MKIYLIIIFVIIQYMTQVFASEDADLGERFYFACKQSEDLQNPLYIQSSFSDFEVPLKDENNQVNIFKLTNRVIKSVYTRIKESRTLNRNIKYCLASETPSADCLQLINWVDLAVPKYIGEARQHLALSQSPADMMSLLNLPRKELNEELSLWSLYKDVAWQALTEDESALAQSRLDRYIKKAVASAEVKMRNGDFGRIKKIHLSLLTVLSLRYQHFVKYKSMLGSLSIMQYLRSPKPSRTEVLAAIDQLELNLKKEEVTINELALRALTSQHTNVFDNSLLDIFDYSSLLEDILIESPKFCPLAARILDFKANRSLAVSVGIGLPILVGSFMVPPMAGLALGVVSGVGFTMEQQYELNQQKNRSFDSVYGDDNSIGLDEVSQTKRARDIGLFLLPAATGASSLLMNKTAGLRFAAYLSAKSIATKDFFIERLGSFTAKIKVFSKVDLTKTTDPL